MIRKGTAHVFFTYGKIGELSESKLLLKVFLGEHNDIMLSILEFKEVLTNERCGDLETCLLILVFHSLEDLAVLKQQL